MQQQLNHKPKIVFLFSDTGGGHRSAAEAIIEAFDLEFPNTYTFEMVDFFKEYSPPPLHLAGPTYTLMSRMEYLWKFTFEVSNDADRMRVIFSTFWPYIRLGIYQLIRDHPCDIYVSVHPIINIPFLRALKRKKIDTPYFIVVTDLVSTHTAWYANNADKIIIPTNQALQPALKAGIDRSKLEVIGQPVAERFCIANGNKKTLREKLGWEPGKTTILLVGGGEGMGPLGKIAREINQADIDASLVVVTGRNKNLQEDLNTHKWNIPTHIYGFVKEMPDFMRAADILVTKAGPGTICEALNADLPIILYHRVPGQEEGNVNYLIDEGAGVWAPDIDDIIKTLRKWVENPSLRLKAAENAKRIAKPKAARMIARRIAEKIPIKS